MRTTSQGPHITRASMRVMKPKPTTIKARAEALLMQADQCDRLYPWPALAKSLRDDAKALMQGSMP